MFDDFQYAYLVGLVFFLGVWLVLFFLRGDLRKEMIIMSFLTAPLGFTQPFYFRDYWRPSYAWGDMANGVGIENILFGFVMGGIAAVIYEEIFGKKYAKRRLPLHPYWMLGFVAFGIAWMFIGTQVLGFNSMYTTIAILLAVGMFILVFRHDLIRDAFFSGLLVGGLMFVFYLFFFTPLFPNIGREWWLLQNLSGLSLNGVPIEELVWAFSWGFVAGPAYEFANGLKFKES
ncbi:MAG: hypothetical protein HY397_01590 [Candidatus Doudnabacteria bacterium]|nr:hypothetical protein [Candidatus Doudnabacteria bacterium]